MDPLSLFSLKNKTAVITGGTGVLGQSMVKEISEAGANVAQHRTEGPQARVRAAARVALVVADPDQRSARRAHDRSTGSPIEHDS